MTDRQTLVQIIRGELEHEGIAGAISARIGLTVADALLRHPTVRAAREYSKQREEELERELEELEPERMAKIAHDVGLGKAAFDDLKARAEQREEKLRAGVRELIEAHDAWSVNSYPSDGGTAIAARAWFDEAQRVEGAVENLRAALAENGDSDGH